MQILLQKTFNFEEDRFDKKWYTKKKRTYGVFAQFLSKISPFALFFDKNSKMKTIYLAQKALHFKKIVAVLDGVFAQFLSKI